MNFLKSNSIRRMPFALAAVAALGFAMTESALATPYGKLGDPCLIHSGPGKGLPGIYRLDPFTGRLACAPVKGSLR